MLSKMKQNSLNEKKVINNYPFIFQFATFLSLTEAWLRIQIEHKE